MSTQKASSNQHSISGLFIFLLIGIFAVFSLLLVLIGVGAYRDAVAEAQRNAQVRTTLSYIANKVRASDGVGGVVLEDWYGYQTLRLAEAHEGESFETRIYFKPGEGQEPGGLYQHFEHTDDPDGPEYDDHIADINALEMSQRDDLLTIQVVTQEGEDLSLTLRLRAWTLQGGGSHAKP